MRARSAAALLLAAALAACVQAPSATPPGIIADDRPEIAARPALYDLADVSATNLAGTPQLFVFQKNGRTLSLFGTMHAVPAGFRWLRPEVRRAFAEADLVMTEVGTTDAAQYNPRTSEMGDLMALLARNDGLNTLDLVALPGTPERTELDAALDLAGVQAAALGALRPWTLCLDLQRGESAGVLNRLGAASRKARIAAMQAVGPIETGPASPDARIERFRLSHGLAHRQLETFATRSRIYSTLPDADALACIRHRAHAIVSGEDWQAFPTRFAGSLENWRRGDVEAARKIEIAETAKMSPAFAVRLYQMREAQWLSQITERCEAAGIDCAIAVGFAHLGGRDGLMKSLERLGYKRVQEAS